jgi:hypothetical protein
VDLALFFVLPLIGGFAFVTQLSLLRYRTGREESQRLYYRAALWGLILAAVAAGLHKYEQHASGTYQVFAARLAADAVVPLLEKERSSGSSALSQAAASMRVEMAVICIYALVLGALAPLWNGLLQVCDWMWVRLALGAHRRSFLDRINLRAISDPLEKLIAKSLYSGTLIQVTLSNSKVYVGSVLESLDPGSPAKYFRIQPWMSGYRGLDGTVEFNTFYDAILAAFEADPTRRSVVETFQLVIPIDKILTASGFDVQAYERFLEERRSAEDPDDDHTLTVPPSAEAHQGHAQVATAASTHAAPAEPSHGDDG